MADIILFILFFVSLEKFLDGLGGVGIAVLIRKVNIVQLFPSIVHVLQSFFSIQWFS